ncbi:nuclease-related domain-containing protein [Sediminibacterium sp.]|uniref:nuclease-related domain-containing protein n=1 Tax=Sediminibacterium sp. TaxID=1917865 RepID=UPI003F71A35A
MTIWIIILFLVSLALVIIYRDIQNDKLLRTVTNRSRGTWSERDLVLRLLKNGFSSERIFHDLYVKKSDGSYSQVDIVILTEVGIIVIEVKHLSGWIFGTGNQTKWVQVLAYGKQKYSFYNPVFQNNSHIKYLKSRLSNLEDIPFYSLIVFYGDCVLKDLSQIPSEISIVKFDDAIEAITKLIQTGKKSTYTNLADIEVILFESVNYGEDRDVRLQHAENIRSKLNLHSF